MKNNETGEFELILGNRQLLSGFFIVVLLFGVAFAMGYIVGRNSSPSSKLQAEASGQVNAATKESRPEPSAAPSAHGPEPTAPQAAEAAAPTPPPAEAPVPSAAPPARDTAPAPVPPAAQPGTPAEPAPGSYWQVLATANRASAEAMQQGLKDKGFPSSLSPGPNNLIRVLVGPYSDTPAMGRAKTMLENSGLHPVMKRE